MGFRLKALPSHESRDHALTQNMMYLRTYACMHAGMYLSVSVCLCATFSRFTTHSALPPFSFLSSLLSSLRSPSHNNVAHIYIDNLLQVLQRNIWFRKTILCARAQCCRCRDNEREGTRERAGARARERERQRERARERERQRETKRDTERQKETQRAREREGE